MYSPDVEKKCVNCQFSQQLNGTTDVICSKYGVVSYNYICKKYKYDIFKKPIHKKKNLDTDYTAEDFSID